MAIEDTKGVKNIEAKTSKGGKTYWTITWHDDKKDNTNNGA